MRDDLPTARRAAFAERIRRRTFTLAPGIHDFVSLRLAERAGFAAVYITGYGISASRFGLPDAGIVSFAELFDAVRRLSEATALPVIADADTGFGGLLNLRHTVQQYERTGACAIQIEDQTFPKKCGHVEGRSVVDTRDMVDRIHVAAEARSDPDFLIVARTDARTSLGLQAAIERARAYRDAGADLIFVESPETADEFARIAAAVDAPLVANMVDHGRSPIIESEVLIEMGFTVAIYPVFALMAALRAIDAAFDKLARTGSSSGSAGKLCGFSEMGELTGFPAVHEFEARWRPVDQAAAVRGDNNKR